MLLGHVVGIFSESYYATGVICYNGSNRSAKLAVSSRNSFKESSD